jgi:hypothetical protein
LVPTSELSRLFTCAYIVVSLLSVAWLGTNIANVWNMISGLKKKKKLMSVKLDVEQIQSMDRSGEGVDKAEFLASMLIQLNDLNYERDIKVWLQVCPSVLRHTNTCCVATNPTDCLCFI